MEDWDIPVEDDFESRYADELEMLDDFEGKCLLLCSHWDHVVYLTSPNFAFGFMGQIKLLEIVFRKLIYRLSLLRSKSIHEL